MLREIAAMRLVVVHRALRRAGRAARPHDAGRVGRRDAPGATAGASAAKAWSEIGDVDHVPASTPVGMLDAVAEDGDRGLGALEDARCSLAPRRRLMADVIAPARSAPR